MGEISSVEHKQRFNKLLDRASVCEGDLEHYALFFIISGNEDLYKKVNYIYDFSDGENCILPDVFDNVDVDLCSSSKTLIKLAFNLYNGYNSGHTVMNTFCYLDDSNFNLAMKAIHIRFGKIQIP